MKETLLNTTPEDFAVLHLQTCIFYGREILVQTKTTYTTDLGYVITVLGHDHNVEAILHIYDCYRRQAMAWIKRATKWTQPR